MFRGCDEPGDSVKKGCRIVKKEVGIGTVEKTVKAKVCFCTTRMCNKEKATHAFDGHSSFVIAVILTL